jgi:Spy/CpxP family protein refolding chaperone
MKTVLSVLAFVLLLSWPMRAQDSPPDSPQPGLPSDAPSGPPPPSMGFRGPQGPPHFGPSPMHDRGFGAWWKNSETVAKLQLSDDQVKRIEQAFLDHRLKLVDLRADLEKQELQLSPLLDADQPDEQKVAAQIDQITSARGRLEKENAMMMLAIRRVLTVEQWKKLQSLRERPRPFRGGDENVPRADKRSRPPS